MLFCYFHNCILLLYGNDCKWPHKWAFHMISKPIKMCIWVVDMEGSLVNVVEQNKILQQKVNVLHLLASRNTIPCRKWHPFKGIRFQEMTMCNRLCFF